MSRYIRPKQTGATIFFTVALQARGSDGFLRNVDILREAVRATRAERPFDIKAWVVLPDHMHCVWSLPPNDDDFSTRWSVIKARYSRQMPHIGRRKSHKARREHGIWQGRFWEHHIRNQADLEAHIRYCWINPVKHGLVQSPFDWPHSSIHRDKPADLLL